MMPPTVLWMVQHAASCTQPKIPVQRDHQRLPRAIERSPPEGREEGLFWREPGGALARITALERGPEARELAARCRARR